MRIKLYTDNRPDKTGKKPVRLSVSLLGKRLVTSLGCAMSDAEFETFSKCFHGEQTTSKVKHPRHNELLRTLGIISDKLEWEVEKVKRGELSAEGVDIAGIVNECKGTKQRQIETSIKASGLFLQFVEDERKKKDLSKSTINQIFCLYRDIQRSYPTLTMERASSKAWVQEYMDMIAKRGYNNTTIQSKYRILYWFLKWAFRNNYCDDDFSRYKFELKTVTSRERLVVFLTMDEIMAIRKYQADPNDVLCRDIFLFQCFTGLRYSDVVKIKNTDIHGDMLTIFTQKTGVLLHNKMNNYALEIVNKYHNKFGETLFPYVSDGTINIHIRRICRQIGIDERVTKYEYRNHQREEISGPKWQFITTHVGRKSFVVNSLDMGLTATQVMGYTGHSSIVAMEPYISISRKKKDSAMDVWNNAAGEPDREDEIESIERTLKTLEERLKALKKGEK
jgi:integrase